MHSQKTELFENFTRLGMVVGVHGLKGELKVFPLTDTPNYYLDITTFFLDYPEALSPHTVSSIRFHKRHWLIQFENLSSRTEAELYRGSHLYLQDAQLRPLAEGEFFLHQIVGCQVENLQGKFLGEVVDIFETGANSVYVVQKENKEFLLPAIASVLKEVDVARKLLRIDPLEGLIDEDQS
ncbi:ribosome maturation factor RimM [Deltaproteobacteria bacterium TL4]